jgi:hypothetical protein
MSVIKNKDNFVSKMTEFFVGVSVDRDGSEGMIACVKPDRFPPMIQSMCGPSQNDLQEIKDYCQEAANESNRKVRIIKFTVREVVEEYLPKRAN